jgi:hypothetical protein
LHASRCWNIIQEQAVPTSIAHTLFAQVLDYLCGKDIPHFCSFSMKFFFP